jgi:hypothetical protein
LVLKAKPGWRVDSEGLMAFEAKKITNTIKTLAGGVDSEVLLAFKAKKITNAIKTWLEALERVGGTLNLARQLDLVLKRPLGFTVP